MAVNVSENIIEGSIPVGCDIESLDNWFPGRAHVPDHHVHFHNTKILSTYPSHTDQLIREASEMDFRLPPRC
jgi:hypothetical protein